MTVNQRIHETFLVPVVVMDDAARTVETADALLAGGVDIMEITLRTPAGLDAIEQAAKNCPKMLVGAGTVLTLDQCKRSVDAGAKFIVSPGFDREIVAWCVSSGIPVLPGCVTPTEITAAMNMGLSVVKFFPANVYGGIKAVKSLAGPFPGVRFVPTGGVDGANLKEFVHPAVFAVGGGWLCGKGAVNSGDYEAITRTCREAAEIVAEARKSIGEV